MIRDLDEKLKEIKELWACEWSTTGTMSAHVRHDDIGWLIETLEGTRKALTTVYNSYCTTTEAMEIQYEELKVDRDHWKQKYLLLQRQ